MKRPAATGLFFHFGDGWSTTTACIISAKLCLWQGVERIIVVVDRGKRLSCPMELSVQGKRWSVVGDELLFSSCRGGAKTERRLKCRQEEHVQRSLILCKGGF